MKINVLASVAICLMSLTSAGKQMLSPLPSNFKPGFSECSFSQFNVEESWKTVYDT